MPRIPTRHLVALGISTEQGTVPVGAYSLVGIALNLRSAGEAGEKRSVQLLSANRSPCSSFQWAGRWQV